MTPELHLVAALGPDRAIGKAGGLPWHFPEDLRRFRKLTTGHAVVMGRATFASIGRPLPNRRNLVVTRDPSWASGRDLGIELASSLDEALALARSTDPAPFLIGGASLYAESLPLATHLHLTRVDAFVPDCDTFFPAWDETAFREVDRRAGETPGLTFVTLVRAPG
jgi:dihydrofolate reductase